MAKYRPCFNISTLKGALLRLTDEPENENTIYEIIESGLKVSISKKEFDETYMHTQDEDDINIELLSVHGQEFEYIIRNDTVELPINSFVSIVSLCSRIDGVISALPVIAKAGDYEKVE